MRIAYAEGDTLVASCASLVGEKSLTGRHKPPLGYVDFLILFLIYGHHTVFFSSL